MTACSRYCLLLTTTLLLTVQAGLAIDSGLTSHFRAWLQANDGYNAAALARDDLGVGGSFGGRTAASGDGAQVRKEPVIFVHGNSDRALHGSLGGWAKAVEYFESKGYRSSELYGTTWGPADSSQATEQRHSLANVLHLRNFIRAVLSYTGAARVDIVSHSMGVTLSRKAIRGGQLDGFDLGPPLTSQVDTFVGLAGANYGLTSCFLAPLVTTCNILDGFYPGTFNPLIQSVVGRSKYLNDLLTGSSGFEGAHRYAVWSVDDELIKYGCIVYGTVTCHFPGMTGHKKLTGGVTHLQVKEAYSVYYRMLTDHIIP